MLVAGCGGASAETPAAATTSASARAPDPARAEAPLRVAGTLGTLPQHLVQAAFESRMNRFNECYGEGLGRLPYLAGEVVFAARVLADGSPRWVFLRRSDVGDRQVEECLIEVARRIHFPEPSGGEAEVSYQFELPAADDARAPERWTASRVAAVVATHRSEIAACRAGSPRGAYSLTLYVDEHGRVAGAGGTGPSAQAETALSCLVAAVRAWVVPGAGNYVGKVTFEMR